MARKSIADRIAEKNLFTMGTDTDKDTVTDTVTDTDIDTELGTGTDTGTVMGTGTDTVIGTDTYLEGVLKPSDVYVRKVYYPLDYQAKYIKRIAKRYKKSESEIVRVALDYFINRK